MFAYVGVAQDKVNFFLNKEKKLIQRWKSGCFTSVPSCKEEQSEIFLLFDSILCLYPLFY
jgi:hypothetical protein